MVRGLAIFLIHAGLGCAPAPPPQARPLLSPAPARPASRPVPLDPAGAAPVVLQIKQLQANPGKPVRIQGVITSILSVRFVPATVVFKISDSTETITVVITQQVQLKEGTRVELVGRYRQIPSPGQPAAGEPPRQAIFEVERFLETP